MPEQFLIDHCSPTLAGLKTANMFPVSLDEDQDIDDEVRKNHFEVISEADVNGWPKLVAERKLRK